MRSSVRWLACVVGEELGVDGLTAAEAFLHAMPELDTAFAEAPAKADFVSLIERGEIEQADVEILYLNAQLLNRFESGLEAGDRRIAPLAGLEKTLAIERHAAAHHDVACSGAEDFIRFLELGFQEQCFADETFHGGKETLGFVVGEVFWHRFENRQGRIQYRTAADETR